MSLAYIAEETYCRVQGFDWQDLQQIVSIKAKQRLGINATATPLNVTCTGTSYDFINTRRILIIQIRTYLYKSVVQHTVITRYVPATDDSREKMRLITSE